MNTSMRDGTLLGVPAVTLLLLLNNEERTDNDQED